MINREKTSVVLSIIIVSYNTRDELEKCITSIYENTHDISFEIIVSDNNSGDGSADMIDTKFPQVKLLRNNGNLGFARATNKAIAISHGRYILLLNSDTIVLPRSLNNMVKFLSDHPDAGAVGAKMLYPDHTLQRTARSFPTPMASFFGRKSFLTKILPGNKFSKRYMMTDKEESNKPYEVDWVSGGAMMIKNETVEHVGVLDERFFIYWEDADWCFRIKKNGWKVFCIPSAPIIHYEGRSSKNDRLRLIIHFHKSVYMFYRKHYIKSHYSIMNIGAVLGLTLRALLIYIYRSFDFTKKV
jgi:hypothetical protein